jgi:hypothetical protein
MIDSDSLSQDMSDMQIAEKEAELEQIVQAAILPYWQKLEVIQTFSNLRTTTKHIVSNFCAITPPEVDETMYMLTLSAAGRHGGSTTKPGNLLLNFRKLVAAVGAGGLTLAGILGPWTGILAALVLWDLLYSQLKVNLSEREAAVLLAMWKNCDLNNQIEQEAIFRTVNETLTRNGRHMLSEEELSDSLKTLEKMSCIQRVASIENRWWLRESVRVPYR